MCIIWTPRVTLQIFGEMHFVDAQTRGFDYHPGFADWMQHLGAKTQPLADEFGEVPAGACGPLELESIWNASGDPWSGHIVDDGRKGPTAVGGQSDMEERDHFENQPLSQPLPERERAFLLGCAMVRQGTYKYTASSHDAPDELYDLEADPDEMNNFALQPRFASKPAEMKAKIAAWHALA